MESPPAAPATPPRPTNTLAIVSLASGIATWILLPIIGAIVAIVTGHMARREIRADPTRWSGEGMALAGLILGYAQIVLIILPACCILLLALLGPGIGSVFSSIVPGN
jgi:hypothetical protein